ncbi:phospholipase D family protein [Marinobacterium jannaschii]|uniref:phospholipase D family protein n=1 Tax=Marinobacterium jannaschii TaxID=64970 RepID=UPI000A00B43A|nr:phospholipase D family protein [Marinobacterium jannaschii]
MRLVTGGKCLSSKIVRLIDKHDRFSFAVAWMGSNNRAFETVCKSRSKLNKAVVGTHFYQTSPDVLDEFSCADNFRFFLQPNGVFHPKVYLFESVDNWDILIGSANFTNGAFAENTELLVHISSMDTDDNIKSEVENTILDYWKKANVVTQEEARSYRELSKIQKPFLQRLSGDYSSSGVGKAPIYTDVMKMSWETFLEKVKADPYHGFSERCDLLTEVNNCFKKHSSFSEMGLGVRKTIAGLPNEWNENWAWFGSMRGAGYFHQAINNNDPYISEALDSIPVEGRVDRSMYLEYIDVFRRAFPNGRDGIGIASRLLALKRPDQFICLDSKNKTVLLNDFNVKKSGLDYDRYWDDLIARITDSVWWNTPRPVDDVDKKVWDSRAAMLDAIFYQP